MSADEYGREADPRDDSPVNRTARRLTARRLIAGTATVAFALAVVLAVPATAATPTKTKKPSDAAIAKQALLTLADFPAGWSQTKHTNAKPTGLASCKPTEQAMAKNKKYRAESPDFAQGNTTFAQNSVFVFPKAAPAKAYLKPFQQAGAAKCLQQGTAKALRKISGVTVQVQQLDLSSALQGGLVDDALGYEVLATIPQQGSPVQLYLVVLAVRIGRGVAGFTTQNAGAVLPDTDSLINASLSRLKPALA